MTRIMAYDWNAQEIEQIAEQADVPEAEVIEALLDALKDNNIDINDYL